MKKTIESIPENNSLNWLIEKINKDIFNGELTEIFEITYSYNSWFNKTLFEDFLWSDYWDIFWDNQTCNINNKNRVLNEVWKKIEIKLNNKIDLLLKYKKEIENLELNLKEEEIISELLVGSLDYWLKILEITKLWLVFELEKAWLKNNLTIGKKQEIINKIKTLEKEVFWWEIKDNSEEVVLAYEFLMKKYELNKNKFSKEQNKRYLELLEKAKKYLPENYKYDKNKLLKKEKLNEEQDFLNKKIPRKKYVNIFQNVFDLLELDIEVKIEQRASIYDGEKHLWIPSNKDYNFMTLRRILELISHEIEAHTVNLKNNQKLIWYFRSAANLEKEEWVAIVMENLLNWKTIDEIWVPQHFPKVFMWEILDWKELKEFLDLNNIIHPDTGHAWRFFRLKRNYDLDLPWVQHKDTSYWRWALKVVDLLKKIKSGEEKDIEVRDLFLWKVGFKDIKKVKELMEIKWLEYNDLHMPLFIGEFVKYLFNTWDNNFNSRRRKNISQKDFIKSLKNNTSYDFLDFNNIEIPVLSYFEKRKIAQILRTIKSTF